MKGLYERDRRGRIKGYHLFKYIGLYGVLSILLVGCASQLQNKTTPYREVFRKGNHNPVLMPLAAEINGSWVRMVNPGTTVEVRAHASDQDGDRLRYRWVPAPDSGAVKQIKASAVRWNVGKDSGEKRLHLIVSDGKGGFAKEMLRLPTQSEIVFSGQVVSNKGKPIDSATVDVNGETTRTDAEGFFKLPVAKANAPRFVLNIRKWGFGIVSQIYDKSVHDGRWIMTPATVRSVDPRQAVTVRDVLSPTTCTGSLTSGIDWINYPQQRIPRIIDTFNQLTSGTIPDDMTQALNIILGGTECSPGINISIPPNTFVDSSGNPPEGNVDVSVSTVDLYGPYSMPGDYSVRTKEGTRWMQSYGAGTIEIRSGGKKYQLKPKATAEITIPVDPTQYKTKGKIPSSIPLLLYDENNGEWTLRGTATLDEQKRAYVGTVDHLSAFNTDLIKTDQACIRFRGDSLVSTNGIAGEYELDAIIPMGSAAPVVRHWNVNPDPDPAHTDENLHVMVNLPSNTWITLVPMRQESGGMVPYGIFGINSGPAQNPTDPNFPQYPYTACQNEITLTDVGGALDITVDGTGHDEGPLPVHFYALTDPSGQVIYPLDPNLDDLPLYGLYDTGTTKVRINDRNLPNRISGSNFGAKDSVHLALTGLATVNLRINGLNERQPDCGVNMGGPGSASPAQVEVAGIATMPYDVDATLIGTAVINEIIAHIDYTQVIDDSACGMAVTGPYIDFYHENDPGIPSPDLILQLERFGNLVSTDGATVGKRYWLRNVVFQNGSNIVADQTNTPDPFDFLFDTGTTLSIVNNKVANTLGLLPNSGTFNCYGGTNNGYVIDSVTILGTDGSYRIDNASICWQESAILSSQIVDAVIGSNFFDQVQIIVNGPNNTLGIIQ